MASARRIKRLGLGEPVRGFQEQRQIVEADGDARVIGAEALLVDGERAPHQRLGLGYAQHELRNREPTGSVIARFFPQLRRCRAQSPNGDGVRAKGCADWPGAHVIVDFEGKRVVDKG